MKLLDVIKNNSKLYMILSIIILFGTIGTSLAVLVSSFNAIAINTNMLDINAEISYDTNSNGEEVTSTGNMLPISDELVTGPDVTDSRILKATFNVTGDSNNPENTIYDIALHNIEIDCDLRTKDLKWRLYKGSELISNPNASLSPTFDTMNNNRLVLTETQEDLTTNTDKYTFLLWISESCTGDITECTSAQDQSKYLGKEFSASIKVELSTKSKKTIERITGSEDSCNYTPVEIPACNTLTYNGNTQTLISTESSEYTLKNTTGINAGTYKITAELNDGCKWSNGSTDDKVLTCNIDKKDVTVTTLDQTITYGNNISSTVSNVSVDGLLTNDIIEEVSLSSDTVDVGTSKISTNNVKLVNANSNDVTSNYNIIKNNTGIVTINCANIAVEPNVGNVMYTGEELTGVTGGSYITITGTKTGTEVGSYKVKAVPNKNYCWSDGTTNEKEYTWNIQYGEYQVVLDNVEATNKGTEILYGVDTEGIYLDNRHTNRMTSNSNPITLPTKEGYTFGGYYTEENGNGTLVINTEGYLINDLPSTTNVLFANWIANTYTVNFYDNLNYVYEEDTLIVTLNGRNFWKANNGGALVGYFYNSGTNHSGPILISTSEDAVTYYSSHDYTDLTSYGSTSIDNTMYYYSSNQHFWGGDFDDTSGLSRQKFLINKSSTAEGHPVLTEELLNAQTATLSETFVYDIEKNLPSNTYTREGYTFIGWSTSPTGEVVYENTEEIVNLTSENGKTINLYAIWRVDNIVSYDANGGSGAPSAQIKKYGSTLNLSNSIPTREGYQFLGWSTNSSATSAIYQPNDTYTSNKSLTLYAIWKANTYTVNFYDNLNYASQAGTIVATLNNRDYYKTNSGGALIGYQYNSNSNYCGPLLVSTNSEALTYGTSHDDLIHTYIGSINYNGTTYYYSSSGHWFAGDLSDTSGFDRKKYMGTQEETARMILEDMSSSVSQSFTYGVSQNLSSNTYTKEGYTFKGWSTSPTGDAIYTDKQSVSNLTSTNGGVINLYAIWEANTYSINFYKNNNYAYEKDQIIVTLNGRTFYKMNNEGALVGYLYNQTYTGPLLVGTTPESVEYYTSDNPNRFPTTGSINYNGTTYYYSSDGYWFSGDVPDTSIMGRVKYNSSSTIAEAAQKLLADNLSDKNQTFVYGTQKLLQSNTYSKAGFTFKGWSTSPTGNVIYNDNESVNKLISENSKNINLYAVWGINYYKVDPFHYYLDNNSIWQRFDSSSTTVMYGHSVTVSNSTPPVGYHSGNRYKAFYFDSTLIGEGQVDIDYFVVDGNIFTEVYYYPDTYTVAYNANGGSGAPSGQTKTYSQTLTLSGTVPTRSGYTFLGWSTSSTATSVTYSAGGSYTANEGVTLYAVWSPIQYTISYNLDGGTVSSNPTSYNIETNSFTLNNPTRTGYTFLGWKENQEQIYYLNKEEGVEISGDEITITNSKSGNTFSNAKIQILSSSGSFITQPTTGYEVGSATGSYYHNLSSGNYMIAIKANGSTADYGIYYNAYLEQGVTYICELTNTIATSQQYKIKNVRFYKQGTNNTGLPIETISKGSYGNKSYTALWRANTYTISYNLDGGTVSGNPTSYNIETNSFTLNNPTRTGYTFLGWRENQDKMYLNSKNQEVTISGDEITITNSKSGNEFSFSKIQMLGSDWSLVKEISNLASVGNTSGTYYHSQNSGNYILAIKANGSTADYGIYYNVYLEQGVTYICELTNTIATSQQYKIKNVRFYKQGTNNTGLPIETISKGSYGNKSYTALWQINTYTVTQYHYYYYQNTTWTHFNTTTDSRNYGSSFAPYNVTPPTGYYAGNNYGYYDSNSTYIGGGTVGSNSFIVTENMKVHVHYYPNSYTVSYNANGGSGAPSSQTKYYATTLTLSDVVPTRSGYTFLGWSTSSSATSASYSAGGSYTANESVTLYAVWRSTYTFRVGQSFWVRSGAKVYETAAKAVWHPDDYVDYFSCDQYSTIQGIYNVVTGEYVDSLPSPYNDRYSYVIVPSTAFYDSNGSYRTGAGWVNIADCYTYVT